MIPHIWTETTADADGRYQLHVEPDGYSLPDLPLAQVP